jgi:hypothetical protein
MKKIIRLTESDLTGLVKRVIEEQDVLNNIVHSRTKLVNALKKAGWKFSPNASQSISAFKPKSGDLMVSGYEGKALVFTRNDESVYLNRDGITVIHNGGLFDEPLKRYKLPKDLNNFISQIQ